MTQVQGKIVLPDTANNFSGATVYVTIEKVRLMDAPATIITQDTMQDVNYSGDAINFSMEADVPDDEQVNVRAHVSMNGSTDFAKGDYITKQSYSLSDNLTLKVEAV